MTRPLRGNNFKCKSNRIARLRRALAISREVLSDMTSISISQIRNIESEKTNMSIQSLSRIAIALECTSDYLIGLSDDPGPKWKDRQY